MRQKMKVRVFTYYAGELGRGVLQMSRDDLPEMTPPSCTELLIVKPKQLSFSFSSLDRQ